MAEPMSDADAEACLEAAKELIETAQRLGGMIQPRRAGAMSLTIMTTAVGILLAEQYGRLPGSLDRMVMTAQVQMRSSAEGWLQEVLRG